MKTKNVFLATTAAILLAVGITTVVLISQPANQVDKSAEPAAASIQGENSEVVRYTATRGRNVLEQLKDHAQVETKDSDFGAYVDAINGIKGGTDNKYWMFYVNDELSKIGAADFITAGGETIEWRFE